MAEELFKKLDKLDIAFTTAMAANQSLKGLLSKYEHTIEKLPVGDAGVAARADQYQNKWVNYLVAQAAFESEVARAASPIQPPKSDLPKEESIKHNGKIETFKGFWKCFERRFVNRTGASQLSDDELHTRLCSLLCENDRDSVLDLSFDEAKKQLTKRYLDPDAIRQYINRKFAKMWVRDDKDSRTIDELEAALREAVKVANAADPAAPELLVLLFNTVYGRLTEELRKDYWRANPKSSGHNPEDLLSFLELTQRILCKDQVALMSIGGPKNNAGLRLTNNKGEPICRYCKDPDHPHFAKDCPKKQGQKCFKCNKEGHIARFCKQSSNNKQIKNYWAKRRGQH